MKKRIWELDAFRGLCVLGMVLVHLVYDLVELYGLVQWEYPQVFLLVKNWGGTLFLVISGICVTLGSRSFRRGILVFSCGMICTLVTWGMYALGFAGKGILIYFGALHCLGTCMMLWVFFRRLPHWALAALGAGLVFAGLWIDTCVRVDFPWLMPLGFVYPGFSSSDYFPLILNLGFFLLGAALGKSLYPSKTTLFPKVNENAVPIRFLRWVGAWSLPIYLLHQPVIYGILMLIEELTP